MGSAPRLTVGLAAFALLLAGGVGIAAAGQSDGGLDRQPRVWDSKADQRSAAASRGRESRRPARASAGKQAPVAAPASNGSSGSASSGSGSGSAATAPAAPVVSYQAPPLSGLSHDAPETAPSVGVIGGGGSSGSPAATPEPSTLLLMGAGLAGLYRLRRQR